MIRKLVVACLAALSLGVAAAPAVAAQQIGPYGGRSIYVDVPLKSSATTISMLAQVWGNGGEQTVTMRLLRYTGSSWVQMGTSLNHNVEAGYADDWWGGGRTCASGTYIYVVEAKWASWSWNDAARTPGKSFTC